MNLLKAKTISKDLWRKLNSNKWFIAVGVGEVKGKTCLYVYHSGTKADIKSIPEVWGGLKVIPEKTGRPRPFGKSKK